MTRLTSGAFFATLYQSMHTSLLSEGGNPRIFMPKNALRIILACWAISLASCVTVPNVSPPPIVVPKGLATADIEKAIVASVPGSPTATNLSPGQQMTDTVLSSIPVGGFGANYGGARTRNASGGNGWFFEGRDTNVVFIGFQHREFYIRVAAQYDTTNITLKILESRNLKQSEDRIHRTAIVWLSSLEGRIRYNLGALALATQKP